MNNENKISQTLGIVAMEPKQEYNASTKYEKLNIVTYQGSSYCALKDTQGNLPTNENFWQLIAQKGDTYEMTEQDIKDLEDKITNNANSEFNKNYEEKLKSFNDNATSSMSSYNSNADSKTTTFDNNVKDKTDTFNSNAMSKNNTFNTNVTNKTNTFNTNANTKQTAYDTNATSKLKTYNDNHTEKLEEYNNNHNTKLAAYNQNADDKINAFDENVENQINHYNNSVTDFETVLDVVTPKQVAKGSEIVIDDALPLPVFETKIEGKSYQDTTAGKNKIGFADMTEKTVQGVTASILDNVISLSGQNSQIYAINVSKSLNVNLSSNADTSCTLSYKVLNGQKNVKLGISFRDENDTQLDYIQDINATDLSTTKVISADTINKTHYFNFFVRTQEVLSDLKIIVQLEFNSAATEVEMYTGGQPSPSPEYPQQIKSIENSINIKVTNSLDINDEDYKEKLLTLDLKNNFVASLNNKIKDYIITNKRKYWLVKNVRKVVLNGNEDISRIETKNKHYRFIVKIADENVMKVDSATADNPILSSHFIKSTRDKTHNEVNGVCYGISSQSYKDFIIYDDQFKDMTIDEFKNWLRENPVEIVYQLAEPEIVELGELEESIRTFEGLNNIQLLTNIDTEFEVKYALDIKKYIDKQNGLQDTQINEINTLLSSAETSAMLLDNYQKDLESEV